MDQGIIDDALRQVLIGLERWKAKLCGRYFKLSPRTGSEEDKMIRIIEQELIDKKLVIVTEEGEYQNKKWVFLFCYLAGGL